jgi:hypothetical protein
MPSLEMIATQQDAQEGQDGTATYSGKVVMEKEMCAMVGFVVKDMAAELSIELLAGFHQ